MKTIKLVCTECEKSVLYSNKFSGMTEAALARRIEKSGLSEEEFTATFLCGACSKKAAAADKK